MAILQPWNMVFMVGFVIYIVIRGVFAARVKGKGSLDRRVGLQEKVLLPAMLISGLLFPVIYLFTPLFAFADYDLPDLVQGCGLLSMTAGLWLFWRSHADLGDNWSATLETRQGHEIVRHGVYTRVRHPMYSAIWLFSIGQALLLDNWLAGWSVVVAFTFMYWLRTPREEQMMIDHFGSAYQVYMNQTGRLIPRLGRRKASESMSDEQ